MFKVLTRAGQHESQRARQETVCVPYMPLEPPMRMRLRKQLLAAGAWSQ